MEQELTNQNKPYYKIKKNIISWIKQRRIHENDQRDEECEDAMLIKPDGLGLKHKANPMKLVAKEQRRK